MPLDLARIQALCFDIDGTLNDTDDQFVEQAGRYFRAVRWLLPGKDVQRAARSFVMWAEAPGNLLLGLPDSLDIDDQLARLAGWINHMRKARIKHFLPIPGVDKMLARLAVRYPLAIVSARDTETSQEFLRQAGIEQYFKCVAGAQTVRHTKPYPDPIYWAAQQMGVPAANCLMIGDTSVDIRAGKAAGAQTVGVLCGFGVEPDLRRRGADEIVAITPQVSDLLLGNG